MSLIAFGVSPESGIPVAMGYLAGVILCFAQDKATRIGGAVLAAAALLRLSRWPHDADDWIGASIVGAVTVAIVRFVRKRRMRRVDE